MTLYTVGNGWNAVAFTRGPWELGLSDSCTPTAVQVLLGSSPQRHCCVSPYNLTYVNILNELDCRIAKQSLTVPGQPESHQILIIVRDIQRSREFG
jgi:hypothetical protein